MRIKNRSVPCFCITIRNLMITFEDGLIITWRFPRFSALYMLFRASFKTLTRTIVAAAIPILTRAESMTTKSF